MKNKRKIVYIIGTIIILLSIFSMTTLYINSKRITQGNEPKYCVKINNSAKNKVTYWGLGYKIIRYVDISPNEPFKNNIGVKIGSWFLKYERPKTDGKNIETIDDFYSIEETKNKDIRKLPKDYNLIDAANDNAYIVENYNLDTYNSFMSDVRNKKTSLIRIVNKSKNKNLIIIDILYYKYTDKIYTIVDKSRDSTDPNVETNLMLENFENIGNFEYENNIYWVVYNNPINDTNLNTSNAYVIAKLTK